ncbi:MAG: peptidylprolyl isomerase [Flavobacteriaceae bacterium]|nr:MAG: peptidylprolyl isomerase [Flavobacteriaceae bacterium]
MQVKKNNLKYINMIKKTLMLAVLMLGVSAMAQERIKIDGVAVVIGKNIVLNSDVAKFKADVEQRSEGKIKISDCEMLEEIMTQKLLAHHAVIDSLIVGDSEVNSKVEQNIQYFTQQLGSLEKVISFYGFNDEADLRKELGGVQKEQLLIQKERASIVEKIDVTPEEVRTYFKNLDEEGNLPEFGAEIELSQIVLNVVPSDKEIKRVIEELNQIKTDISNGSSFKLKAILNSDDPAVSSDGQGGGGLYTITRESGFIKEFKEVAFSLDEGEISEPFKSGFGYHIIFVEKIKGRERDVRHILMQPKISNVELKKTQTRLDSIKKDILDGKITFEEAVFKNSNDKGTKHNKGVLMNPDSKDTHFDLTRMDPSLYARVSSLKSGEITDTFYDEIRGGDKMFKIILMKSKVDAHTASFTNDYVKIQRLTLQKKQEESIEKWAKEKIADTYIKINKDFKDCSFKKNWLKEK